MVVESYSELFRVATAGNDPYPYQVRLAEAPELPSLLEIPTGAGKTLATFLAWLWRRRYHPDPKVRVGTPRRLVYCLPMRVLVEQTVGVIRDSLRRVETVTNTSCTSEPVKVAVLMGGEDDGDWDEDPTSDAVIVGTQDMLLSRALNRGYGMSRFRWPVHFGFVNSDCLWIVDEVQLMGNGLATTTQLDGFRQAMHVAGSHHTIWMSATIHSSWLGTIDSRITEKSPVLSLAKADRTDPRLSKRLTAAKALSELALVKDGNPYNVEELGKHIALQHVRGTLTLIVVNTVDRAQSESSK